MTEPRGDFSAPTEDNEISIVVPEPAITRWLYLIAALLVAMFMTLSFNRYVLKVEFFGETNVYALFNLWSEVSIPTWYSASLLLLCSGVLAVIAVAKWRVRDHYRLHWVALAVLFLELSLDDSADFHGQTSYKLGEMVETGGLFSYAWVIPGTILAIITGLLFLGFLRHLPPLTRRRFVTAGALFLAGALVLEMVGAWHDTSHGIENMTYRTMVAVEEGLEMAGTIMFLSASLRYLSGMAGQVRLRLDPDVR